MGQQKTIDFVKSASLASPIAQNLQRRSHSDLSIATKIRKLFNLKKEDAAGKLSSAR